MSLSAEVARTQLDNWPKVQVECGATKTVINSTRPMAPAVPRAPQASPPGIPVAGSGLAPFRHFFLACWGVPAPKGHSKGFPRSGRILGGMGPERCGSGAPIDPSNGPIAGLVERDTFFLTPLLGCSKPHRAKSGPVRRPH